MSSFMVRKESIDIIVTHLTYDRQTSSDAVTDAFGFTGETELGQRFWNLNAQAVNDRYKTRDFAPVYVFTRKHASLTVVYKTLQCLLYQCSEGAVPDSRTYKQLDILKQRIADRIISDSKEYQDAVWG